MLHNIVESESGVTMQNNIVESESGVTMQNNIVESESGVTMLNNIVEPESRVAMQNNIVECESGVSMLHNIVDSNEHGVKRNIIHPVLSALQLAIDFIFTQVEKQRKKLACYIFNKKNNKKQSFI